MSETAANTGNKQLTDLVTARYKALDEYYKASTAFEAAKQRLSSIDLAISAIMSQKKTDADQ